MRISSALRRAVPALLSLAAMASLPALAGTMSIAWDPVTDTDLAGYRVYYGTSPGSYSQSVDVGNVTSTTLTGLADCTSWFVAVKAYDTAGNLSQEYSNEVSGWPRPVVSTASPSSAEQGRTLTLTITGSNFQTGATVEFANAAIVVNSTTVGSCTQLTTNITVGASAAVGPTQVDVVNSDGVFGAGPNLFTVEAAVAPTVQSTQPTDGATGISVSVHPTVTFSEPMLPSSITASTVELLNSSNAAVPQAASSPSLSGDGRTVTITPASDLTSGATYRIRVIGGATGVKDLANNAMASNYVHATGFTTVPDATAPTISAVASSNVASTTARITWTTDESADSQVFYRKQGETGYQQTTVATAMVTSHSVDLAGLAPSTNYEYYVRSADAAGNASTSSPNRNLTTTASSYAYLRFDAEGGTLVSPVRTQSGSGSFGGSWIDTPSGTSTGTATAPSGTATFGINIPSSGTWYVWVRMFGPNANADTWFESMNGAARQNLQATTTNTWVWVAGRSYTLNPGLNSFELGGREAQARADRILLTTDPTFVPTEQPVDDQTPPAAVTGFTAVPSTGQNTLNWTNPGDADFSKSVIRYRTDGRFPTGPLDGFPVTEEPAAPGSSDSFVHGGLTNGTTYSYSAFALDASGNVSRAATAAGTPSDGTPPGRVNNARRSDKKPKP